MARVRQSALGTSGGRKNPSCPLYEETFDFKVYAYAERSLSSRSAVGSSLFVNMPAEPADWQSVAVELVNWPLG